MVLGAVGAQLPGEVRRRQIRRLPGLAARALVRRSAADAGADLLDEAAAARAVSPICTARPRRRSRAATTRCPNARRIRRRRFRSAPPAPAKSCSCSTSRCGRFPPGEIGDLYIGGVGLALGYWRDPRANGRPRSCAIRRRPAERIYKTGDLARTRRRRPGLLPRAQRLADQEPRLPHRARRDRSGAERGRRRRGVRGRRRRHRRLRGHRDLLRLRAGAGKLTPRRPTSAAS